MLIRLLFVDFTVLFCECRGEVFRATPAAQKIFHFSLAIPKRFAIVSPIEGNQSDEQPKSKMKTYIIRSTKTGEYRTIAPCDSREHSTDHLQFTADRQEAAEVFGEDVPDETFLRERGLELEEVNE
jgi:hypothetical protein